MPGVPRVRRNRIILVLILIVCVTMITVYAREGDNGPLHKIQSFFTDIITPFTSALAKIFRPIRDGIMNIVHLPSLLQEKRELEEQVVSLRREALETRELRQELDRLKALLRWSEENPYKDTVGAEIVAQSPDNWRRLMIVNKGSSHGVKKYMSVVTDSGLVGRIISVGSRSSVVQLITDAQSAVGGRNSKTRETGILEGRNESTLRFIPMNEDAVFKFGDMIVTSGMGGTCPPGIPVGKVTEVRRRGRGLTRLVIVKPFVQFSRLDKVLIIITPEPESAVLKEVQ